MKTIQLTLWWNWTVRSDANCLPMLKPPVKHYCKCTIIKLKHLEHLKNQKKTDLIYLSQMLLAVIMRMNTNDSDQTRLIFITLRSYLKAPVDGYLTEHLVQNRKSKGTLGKLNLSFCLTIILMRETCKLQVLTVCSTSLLSKTLIALYWILRKILWKQYRSWDAMISFPLSSNHLSLFSSFLPPPPFIQSIYSYHFPSYSCVNQGSLPFSF